MGRKEFVDQTMPNSPQLPFERVLRKTFGAVEGLAAALVLLDIILLFAGVVARYVFDKPLTWSDEVAVIAFLWITMLGSAIAAHAEGHMRLTVVVGRLEQPWKSRIEMFARLVALVLLGCLLLPSIRHAREHWTTLTPALRISDGLRLCALAVGLALMSLAVASNIVRAFNRKSFAGASVAIALLLYLLWLSKGWLHSFESASLLVFFVIGVIGCVLAGVPIAFAFGACTAAYIEFSTTVPLTIVVARMDGGISELLLLSVPLFVVLGLLLELTGMAASLIRLLVALLGHLRGGLSYALLGAMFLVSGISGSKAADMAAVAPVLFPEMKKAGYEDGELVAMLASSGAMSETIPPSLVLIALGAVAGLSIASLFAAGILPAALGALALIVVAAFRARSTQKTTVRRASRVELRLAFVGALPVLLLPVLIRTAVVEGVATATEVATIGVVYTLLVGLVLARGIQWTRVYSILIETASLSGVIMLILGMATAMAWALTQSGASVILAEFMSRLPGGKLGFLVGSIFIFVVLGSLLEGLPALVVLGPLLFPAAETAGIHQIHYAMVVILAMGLGLFSPPFGVGYYMACTLGKISPDQGVRAIWPYLGALLAVTLIVAAVPWISLALL